MTGLPDRMLMLSIQIRKFAAILQATIPHLTSSPGNNTFHFKDEKIIIIIINAKLRPQEHIVKINQSYNVLFLILAAKLKGQCH